ncbi:hypothetical protein [Pseudoalteromonas sp. BMB]|uniref:hypothetical protein n=1 Tax=Pseudoalteromonas sp. BMB TaxID=1874619 RepID=UPI001585FB65|nr:hypothetical protein [Pseudoalteromonas sp. BMB]
MIKINLKQCVKVSGGTNGSRIEPAKVKPQTGGSGLDPVDPVMAQPQTSGSGLDPVN